VVALGWKIFHCVSPCLFRCRVNLLMDEVSHKVNFSRISLIKVVPYGRPGTHPWVNHLIWTVLATVEGRGIALINLRDPMICSTAAVASTWGSASRAGANRLQAGGHSRATENRTSLSLMNRFSDRDDLTILRVSGTTVPNEDDAAFCR